MRDRQIAICISQLVHKSESVRRTSMRRLTKFGAQAVPALIDALKSDEYSMSANAARVLGMIGDASATPALIEALTDGQIEACLDYARSLAVIGDPRAAPALIDALDLDEAETFTYEAGIRVDIFTIAADAFVKFGAIAAPGLIAALYHYNNSIRTFAAEALGRMGDSCSLPRNILADARLSAQDRIDALQALLRAYAAGKLGARRTIFTDVPAFCRMVLLDGSPEAHKGAQTVLNWLNGDRDLLHASERDRSAEADQLLRAARTETHEGNPETLLLASDAPDHQQ